MLDILHGIYAFGRLHTERPAIVTPTMIITYGEFLAAVLSVEMKIAEMALDPEKPVAVVIADPARHLTVTLALAKQGFATLSPPRQLLGKSIELGVGAVIVDEMLAIDAAAQIYARDDWFLGKPSLAEWRTADLADDRIVRLALTSGTTGPAKAAAFTSYDMWARHTDMKDRLMMGAERVLLQFGLVSHVGYDAALLTLTQGRTLYFARTPAEAVILIRASSVDMVAGSVLQFKELVNALWQLGGSYATFDSVRTAIIAGSYMSMDLLGDLRRAFRGAIYQIYGATEAGSMAVNVDSMMEADCRTNRFVPMKDLSIVKEQPAADIGIISVTTPHLGAPYAGALIAETLVDVKIAPGDLGYVDAAGFLVVAGRYDDVINIGGVKRSVDFFEDHFRKAPGIRDCAVAIENRSNGPGFTLFVVSDREPDAAALKNWGERDGLRFVIDRVLRVDAIPRNSADKIEREQLRRMADAQV